MINIYEYHVIELRDEELNVKNMFAVIEAPFPPEGKKSQFLWVKFSTMAISYKDNFVKGLKPGVISKVG